MGLVSTNSIRGGANRRALQAALVNRPIFEAWSDEPWVVDGSGGARVPGVLLSSRTTEPVQAKRPLDGNWWTPKIYVPT